MTFIPDVDRLASPDGTGELVNNFLAEGEIAPIARVLVVDDDPAVLMSLAMILERAGFHVKHASNVNHALQAIGSHKFDVLLSDLHMPAAGDGLTVVSAMRHKNPQAVTILFSGYPEMKEAAAAIVLQADEILLKPMSPDVLLETIKLRLKLGATSSIRIPHTVAHILETNTRATIADWLTRVEGAPDLISVPLPAEERCAHLPHLFRDLITRLRTPLELGTRALAWSAAGAHGVIRRRQGYSAAMIVEESRMLQVSIFQMLQNNLHQVDFSLLLLDVMVIADEVDSQLAQAMAGYVAADEARPFPLSA